jgi:mono/diheme cytochrome c family protein
MPSKKWIWISAALLLGILAAACAPNPQPPGLTAIPSLAPGATVTLLPAIQGGPAVVATPGAGDAAAGAAVFLKNCSPCHGNQAQGGIGPALRNNPVITSGDQAVFNTIAGGIAGSKMPAWSMSNGGPLTSSDISNVIAYLKTLQNVQPLPSPTEAPAEPTETPLPANAPTPEPARPSNAGGPGKAVALTGDPARGRAYFGQFCAACHGPEGVQGVPNPGSEDGSVPPLNPIDPTIANPDLKVFAQNVDLFIEHGSVPDGENPQIIMPSFGDSKLLTDQQIADIIAFIIQLNAGK